MHNPSLYPCIQREHVFFQSAVVRVRDFLVPDLPRPRSVRFPRFRNRLLTLRTDKIA